MKYEPAMDGLRAMTQIAIGEAVPMAIVFAFLVFVEMAFRMPSARTGDRLRAISFWIVYITASAATLTLWYRLLNDHNIHPLVDLDITPHGLWKWALLIPAVLVASLFADFAYYWCHRAQHRFFWRFHAVHHSIRNLSAVNSYHHWTEDLMRLPLMTAPLALLINVHADGGVVIGALLAIQTWWIHAPLSLRIGPLRYLLNEPQMHRIHHSNETRHFERNFGGFSTVWDQIFGTSYFPARDEWPAVGIAEHQEPASLLQYVMLPFRNLAQVGAVSPSEDTNR